MTETERAYEAARAEIERVRSNEGIRLDLSGAAFHALDRIPPEVASLNKLETLDLSNTQVGDLEPLATTVQYASLDAVPNFSAVVNMATLEVISLGSLKALILTNTLVSELHWLRSINSLSVLELSGSKVYDLRPLVAISGLKEGLGGRVSMRDTPFSYATDEQDQLAAIPDDEQRTHETLTYLATLPPWPEPLPWGHDLSVVESRGRSAIPTAPTLVTARSQIAFLLKFSAVTQVSARDTAEGIRQSLKDIQPEPGTNRLPEIFETALDVARILDRISNEPIDAKRSSREAALVTEIAALEETVERLTRQLSDSEKARIAAEAITRESSSLSLARKGAATTVGVGGITLIGLGFPTALTYFLGVDHPLIQAYLTVLGRLPR